MASYDAKYTPIVNQYLAGGGTQADVDAYFAGNPDAAKVQADAGAYFGEDTGGEAAGRRGTVAGALSAGPLANSPQVIAQQQLDQNLYGPGSGTIYDPWMQPNEGTKGYGKGAKGAVVKFAGGTAPAAGATGTLAPAGSAALNYAGLGTLASTGPAPTMGGSYTGGGGGGTGGYTLPQSTEAAQALRDLQLAGAGGLQGLLTRDTTAQRKAMEDALYTGQAEGINSAADRSRQAMLEGTFGRGVGSSSILVELAGRGEQERADALARARREAFTQAGSEDRADLASQLGLSQAGFNAGTTGLQGEANVALANLARELQASQFDRNLGFQGSENAANRAQQASQFGANQALSYAQLGQQGSQFGQNLAFQGSENAANRAASSQEAELNRQLQQLILESQQTFAGGQNQLSRDAAAAAQASSQGFAGGQNQAARDAAAALQASSQGFQGGQNQAARDAAAAAQASSQGFAGTQNQLSRDAQNQQQLLALANAQDIAEGNRIAAGLGAAGTGAGALLGPWLAQYIKDLGS